MSDTNHDPNHDPTPTTERRRGVGRAIRLLLLFVGVVGSIGGAWYSLYVPANDIAWAADFDAARRRAAETGRPIVLFFSARWCTPCRVMKREVWADDDVEAIVDRRFVAVAIDVEEPDAVAAEALRRYPVGVWPTTVVTDPRGEVLARVEGGRGKAEFLELLRRTAAGSR